MADEDTARLLEQQEQQVLDALKVTIRDAKAQVAAINTELAQSIDESGMSRVVLENAAASAGKIRDDVVAKENLKAAQELTGMTLAMAAVDEFAKDGGLKSLVFGDKEKNNGKANDDKGVTVASLIPGMDNIRQVGEGDLFYTVLPTANLPNNQPVEKNVGAGVAVG